MGAMAGQQANEIVGDGHEFRSKNQDVIPSSTTLFYSIDQQNVNAMLVSLSSALEHNRDLDEVCVLYAGKRENQLCRLLDEVCGEVPFKVFDTGKELDRLKREKFPTGTIGEIAYLKFLVPEFANTRRAIFLDADTIVRADLQGLFEQDLKGKSIGAVQDWLVPSIGSTNSPIREYVDSEIDLPYFNSGVMLMDVDRLKGMDLMNQLTKLRHVKTRYADQDLFNLIFLRDWTAVDPVWNFPMDERLPVDGFRRMHSELWQDRKIDHYIGKQKPWIFPFNFKVANRDFSECRRRSKMKYWIPNPFSPSSMRYYTGFLRRKLGGEF